MKRISISVALVLVFALLVVATRVLASPASFQGQQQTPGAKATQKAEERTGNQGNTLNGKHENYKGTVSAVDSSSITLTLRDGSSVTVGLISDTRIKFPGPKGSAPTGIQPGTTAMVQAIRDQAGNLVARSIMVIPGKPSKTHRVGVVTAYSAGSSITIQDKDGNLFSFALSAETRLLPAERADTLAVGSKVTIIAPRDPATGGATANGIVIHPAGN